MATQDYVINSEHGDTLVEVEKRKFARSIVDELIIERKRLGLTQ